MAILKDLIVHGSSRFLNKIYADELETSAFEADSAVIKKLKADEATVVGLLDVQGQLHTNTWTNSNIATIDGCFYITPTIGSNSGNIVFSSVNEASLTGDFTAVNSLYIGNSSSGSTVQWTSDSNVLLTGEVKVNGQWLPLGTLLGTLSANAITSSIELKELKDNRHNDSSIVIDIRNAIGSTRLEYRNLKISLYQRASNSKLYPMGIYMTALGSNNKTFIDIYGGVQDTSKAQGGGFTKPNVRIGNLSGLDSVGGISPIGWGIYTTNGYFDGVIVSNRGNIGGWNLTADSIWKNNENFGNANGMYFGASGISLGSTFKVTNTGVLTATAGTIAGWNIKSTYLVSGSSTVPAANTLLLSPAGTVSSYSIAGQNKTGWMITAGTTFGVNKDGGIYATAGKIGGFDIGSTYIKNIKTSYSEATNNGVWVGTDGIGLGKGLFYVTNAGSLTAKSGSIAGWSFNASSLYKTNATPGYNASTMVLSTGTASTNNIGGGGTASKTWMISAGTGFGVTTTGALYCNDAHVSGEITATSGAIGGINITDGKLDVSAINIGDLSGEIGGRNLLRYTSMPCTDLAKIGASSSNWSAVVEDNIQCIKGTGNNTTHLFSYISTNLGYQTEFLKANTTYTYSAWIKVSKAANFDFTHYGHFQVSNNASTASDKTHEDIVSERIYEPKIIPANTWTKIRLTFTTNNLNGSTFGLYPIYNNGADTVIYMYGWKLEKGNKATDWTPAPQDIDVGITSAATTASNYLYASSEGLKIASANPSTTAYYQLQKADRTAFYVNNTLRSEITYKGFYIYNDNAQIASFDVTTSNSPIIKLGLQTKPHFYISDTGIIAYKDNNKKYFEVGAANADAVIHLSSDEEQYSVTLANTVQDITGVTVGQVATTDYTWDEDTHTFVLNFRPAKDTNIIINYIDTNNTAASTTIVVEGLSETFDMSSNCSSVTNVKVDGVSYSSYEYDSNMHLLTLNPSPASGSDIEVTYVLVAQTPYFTFGSRDSASNTLGNGSFSSGEENRASALNSFASGYKNSVYGNYGAAFGQGVTVAAVGGLACGRYNQASSSFLFSVGYGTSSTNRKSAFQVANSGNVFCYEKLTCQKKFTAKGISDFKDTIFAGGRRLFKLINKTSSSTTINANGNASVTIPLSKTGYYPVAIRGVRVQNSNCYPYNFYISGTSHNFICNIHNTSSSSVTTTVIVDAIYISATAF